MRIKSTDSSPAPCRSVQPLPGSAQPLARTTPAKLTAGQRAEAGQYAHDIDHWIEMLNTDDNGGYANSWLIDDVPKAFLRMQPQWNWQQGYLKDRPQQPWTYIRSDGATKP